MTLGIRTYRRQARVQRSAGMHRALLPKRRRIDAAKVFVERYVGSFTSPFDGVWDVHAREKQRSNGGAGRSICHHATGLTRARGCDTSSHKTTIAPATHGPRMMLRLLQARRLSPLLSPARRFSTQDIAAARLNEVKAGAAAVTSWVNLYTGALSEYPLRANAVLSGVLCAAGDVLAQTVEQRVEVSATRSYDLLRTARMTTYGTLICGPLLYGWYSTLHVLSLIHI